MTSILVITQMIASILSASAMYYAYSVQDKDERENSSVLSVGSRKPIVNMLNLLLMVALFYVSERLLSKVLTPLPLAFKILFHIGQLSAFVFVAFALAIAAQKISDSRIEKIETTGNK